MSQGDALNSGSVQATAIGVFILVVAASVRHVRSSGAAADRPSDRHQELPRLAAQLCAERREAGIGDAQ